MCKTEFKSLSIEDSLKLQYPALRDEFLRRIEMRQRIVEITLGFAGILFTIALANPTIPSVASIYPIIAAFLALGWLHQDNRVSHLVGYMRNNMEKLMSENLRWETYYFNHRQKETNNLIKGIRTPAFSHLGMFLFTQLMATIISLFAINPVNNEWHFLFNPSIFVIILLIIDILSIGIVIVFIRSRLIWKNSDIIKSK